MLNREYGVNVVCYFPFCLGANGLKLTLISLLSLGYSGVQALPMRGWNSSKTSFADFVISVEDAWGSPSFWHGLRRMNFINFVLFQSEEIEGFPFSMKSSHQWEKGSLVEVYPELCLLPHVYVQKYQAREIAGLCVDTFHIRRSREDRKRIDWVSFLRVTPSEAIKLIHVQPHEDLKEYLRGEDCPTARIMHVLRHKGVTAPVIMEIRSPLLYLTSKLRRNTIFEQMLAVTKKHMGDT